MTATTSGDSRSPEECAWLIHYEDADRPIEVFVGSGAAEAAAARSKDIGQSWNHTLFVDVSALAALLAERDTLAAEVDTQRYAIAEYAGYNQLVTAERDTLRAALQRIAGLTELYVQIGLDAPVIARDALRGEADAEIQAED